MVTVSALALSVALLFDSSSQVCHRMAGLIVSPNGSRLRVSSRKQNET